MLRATQLSGASPQGNAMEDVPHKQMRNFLALKTKIIHTDELIGRFKQKVSECEVVKKQLKESQARLASLEQGMVGLRVELQATHEENKQLHMSLACSGRELERVSNQLASSDQLVQQLMAQVTHQRVDKDCEAIKKERDTLQEDKERWMRRYQNLRRQLSAYQASHSGPALLSAMATAGLLSDSEVNRKSSSTSPDSGVSFWPSCTYTDGEVIRESPSPDSGATFELSSPSTVNAVSHEVEEDFDLSCSETNSECSELSLSSVDELADLLTSATGGSVPCEPLPSGHCVTEVPPGDCATEEPLPSGHCVTEEPLPSGDCVTEEPLPSGDCAMGEPLSSGHCATEEVLPSGDCATEVLSGDSATEEPLSSGDSAVVDHKNSKEGQSPERRYNLRKRHGSSLSAPASEPMAKRRCSGEARADINKRLSPPLAPPGGEELAIRSVSPLPEPPVVRFRSLSPLPPSPEPSSTSPTPLEVLSPLPLSPLPLSPPHTLNQWMDITLSPLPPSPNHTLPTEERENCEEGEIIEEGEICEEGDVQEGSPVPASANQQVDIALSPLPPSPPNCTLSAEEREICEEGEIIEEGEIEEEGEEERSPIAASAVASQVEETLVQDPCLRPSGGIASPMPSGGIAGLMLSGGVAGPMPSGGIAGPMPSPSGGIDCPMPSGGVAGPMPSGGVAGPMSSGGIAGPMPSPSGILPSRGIDCPMPFVGVACPMPSGGIASPRPSDGVACSMLSGGVACPRPFVGIACPMPSGGVTCPRPSDGIACPMPSGGVGHTQQQRPAHGQPSAAVPLPPEQRQLVANMQCPLPLPAWLVSSMVRVQCCEEHLQTSRDKKKIKKCKPKQVVMRQNTQRPSDYLLVNLDRLVCGHLHLSTAVAMFGNPRNVPSTQDMVAATVTFLCDRYFPRIEHVVSLYHSLCDAIRANTHFQPRDSACPAPLTRTDCQIVALLATVCRTNKQLVQLLPELSKALQQAILSPWVKFHSLHALCRVFVSVCRLLGDSERVHFLVCDLLCRPLLPNELPVLVGVASIWPAALGRRPGVAVMERNQLVPAGVEAQALCYTIEVVAVSVINKAKKKGRDKDLGNMLRNFRTLCNWSCSVPPHTVNQLAKLFINTLQTNTQIFIDSVPPGVVPWRRPRPSLMAFRVVHCLRMLVWLQGWTWTNDTLIGTHLWPLLQKWHGKEEIVREATVVCAIRLIGFVAQHGLSHDANSSSIQRLQQVLLSFLSPSSTASMTLPIQLATADSLLDLCPAGSPRASEAVLAVSKWVQRLPTTPAKLVLAREFHGRLIKYGS